MSVIYGVLMPEGAASDSQRLGQLRNATARYAPDETFFRTHGRLGMGFQLYQTHTRSKLELEPATDDSGNMVTFDGRLDNHVELAQILRLDGITDSDSRIVLAAFALWGEKCFANFSGDWAIALWSQTERALYLARDHAGTRTLYFWNDNESLLWSTYIDASVMEEPSRAFSLAFARAYLFGVNPGTLTPFDGIKAVPASHYVRFGPDNPVCIRHWDPLSAKEIRYADDNEYEEAFRHCFGQAVQRRIQHRSFPVIAELSGGMDSSSIVCMADWVSALGNSRTRCIETLSYYDDSEPNWNERPYFSAVEEHRNHIGIHLEFSFAARDFEPVPEEFGTYLWPGASRSSAMQNIRIEESLRPGGFRSILSGLGGDELLGGVPYPLPELADYLVAGRFDALLSQGIRWCLEDRSPLLWMMWDVLVFTTNTYRIRQAKGRTTPPWLLVPSKASMSTESSDLPPIVTRLDRRPSALAYGSTWRSLTETLPSNTAKPSTRYEYLYPYMDKDLVNFLLGVPREQLLRPGRRRSLMRRALRDIVPTVVLERRRKAYAIQGPLRSLRQAAPALERLFEKPRVAEMGLVEPRELRRCMAKIIDGTTTQWWPALVRTALYELWVENLMASGSARCLQICNALKSPALDGSSPLYTQKI
jgi:asparagine synthase (glutamine-hydrolysing)